MRLSRDCWQSRIIQNSLISNTNIMPILFGKFYNVKRHTCFLAVVGEGLEQFVVPTAQVVTYLLVVAAYEIDQF